MHRIILALIVALTASVHAQTTQATTQLSETLSLDRGWLFHEGDIPFPVISGQDDSYNNAKAGKAWGAAASDYDDSKWRTLDLPHDWAVEQPFDEKANPSQGYRPRGFGWYRRWFSLDPSDRGKHLELQFDAVATHCTVWVNGIVAAHNFCGYTGFNIDITPFARFGNEPNLIVVRVDAVAQEGWWYEGAGIYRHTWLIKQNPLHLAADGVFAQPVRSPEGGWSIPVEATVANSGEKSDDVSIESTLLDPQGREVGFSSGLVHSDPFVEHIARCTIGVTEPKLWTLEEPTLYTVHTVLKQNGNTLDEKTTTCGFRTIRFDSEKGFFLNDQPLKLKGTCNHQDHAGVGVAVPDALWDFRVRKLKEMGSNAYRCAHNPPAAEFLEACDRQGLLVMDENRNFNTNEEYLEQLRWMVKRDRNHPSIVLWSVFNEEPMQASQQGYEMVRKMVAIVRQLDPTRPVTAAQSGGMMGESNASLAADVAGINYQIRDYDPYHAKHPDKPMTSSEDTSAQMTRGEYTTDLSKCIFGSYDDDARPWGATQRKAWMEIEKRPFLAGGFDWTGFDYRGEPQPFIWPATGSSFGIMDLCGFPKTAFYIKQAQFIPEKPILQIVPHWNWAGSEGKEIRVMAVSNGESVELMLNGKSLGSQAVAADHTVNWKVPYQPGKLEAIAKRGDKEWARCVVETTGEAKAIQLVPDREMLKTDGVDAIPITVQAVDVAGRVVPGASQSIHFELAGSAKIIGLGNGDPTCHEPEKGSDHSLFHGLAQVIIQSNGGNEPIKLTATSNGLKTAEITIHPQAAATPPSVATIRPPMLLTTWQMSPTFADRPDPSESATPSDANTWSEIRAGKLSRLKDGRFALLRTTLHPTAEMQKRGGAIVFERLNGKAQVYLNGKLIAEKKSSGGEELKIDLPPQPGDGNITVLLETEKGEAVGLNKPVRVVSN